MIPYFELGIPARIKRDAQTPEDIEKFRNKYMGKNIYISVYKYASWDEKEKHPDYETAIVDKLFFEIESEGKNSNFNEEVHGEEQKLLIKMKELKIPYPEILFSGRRGYHNLLYFPPVKLRNINETLKRGVENIFQKEMGIKNICLGSQKGTTQMKRLVNSHHSKTGLYAVPISPEEVLLSDYKKILELAKKPRKIDFEKNFFLPLHDYLLNIDGLITREHIEENKVKEPLKKTSPLFFKEHKNCPFINNSNNILPPCINKLLSKLNDGVNLTHFERFIFTSFMGMFLKNKDKEEIILKYFVNEPDFNETKTRYQIHHILSKKYFPPRCETLKKVGLCKEK